MARWYDIPKDLHPDFSRGRKPTGSVSIDWENPITRGLELYLPFSSAQPLEEVTKRNRAKVNAVPYGTPTRHVIGGRECWGFNLSGGATQHISMGQSACRPGSDDFTYGVWVWMDGGTSSESTNVFMSSANTLDVAYRYGFWGNDTNTTHTIMYDSATGGGPTAQDDATGLTASDSENKWVLLLHVLDRNGASPLQYYYRDGELLLTGSAINNTAFDDPGNDLKIGAYGDGSDPATESQNRYETRGYISDVYWWRRALDQSEIKSLYDAPYQILRPQAPMGYYLPAIGGGPWIIDVPPGGTPY